MKRIGTFDNLFHDTDQFHDGTVITAKWLNDIQEEISNAIEALGVTLNGSISNQLASAIIGSLNLKANLSHQHNVADVVDLMPTLNTALKSVSVDPFSLYSDYGISPVVFGDAVGALPDAATQNKINALISLGIPSNKIGWVPSVIHAVVTLSSVKYGAIYSPVVLTGIQYGSLTLPSSTIQPTIGGLFVAANGIVVVQPTILTPTFNVSSLTGNQVGTINASVNAVVPTIANINIIGNAVGTITLQANVIQPTVGGLVVTNSSFVSIQSMAITPTLNSISLVGNQIGNISAAISAITPTFSMANISGIQVGNVTLPTGNVQPTLNIIGVAASGLVLQSYTVTPTFSAMSLVGNRVGAITTATTTVVVTNAPMTIIGNQVGLLTSATNTASVTFNAMSLGHSASAALPNTVITPTFSTPSMSVATIAKVTMATNSVTPTFSVPSTPVIQLVLTVSIQNTGSSINHILNWTPYIGGGATTTYTAMSASNAGSDPYGISGAAMVYNTTSNTYTRAVPQSNYTYTYGVYVSNYGVSENRSQVVQINGNSQPPVPTSATTLVTGFV